MTAKHTDKSGPRVWIVETRIRQGDTFVPRRDAWLTKVGASENTVWLRGLYGRGNVRVVEYDPVERG